MNKQTVLVTGKVVAGIGITGVLQKDTHIRFREWELAVNRCAGTISSDIGYVGDAYGKFEEAIKVGKPPTDIDLRRTQGVRP